MFKAFLKSALLSLFFLALSPIAWSSGKMEAKIGERVVLQAKDQTSALTYKWVAKKGSDIVTTQTISTFTYTFLEQGEYDVNLTVTDAAGRIGNTSIFVLVGDRYKPEGGTTSGGGAASTTTSELKVTYSTLPAKKQDGSIHLAGDGKVFFEIQPLPPDVIEYRIDRNVFADSDGNGVANDDIDNASDDSYLLGGAWVTDYKVGESGKTTAEITLVARDGRRAKAQVEIVFDTVTVGAGDPVAIMEAIPTPNPADQTVHLYEDGQTVGFYARPSLGKILEYRIDKNIFVDSNGDGNPSNDTDNLNDPSLKTGDIWYTQYAKTDAQIIAQLIVVGENGKGSRIQRGIKFTDRPTTNTQQGIYVEKSSDFVLVGDPITFRVAGLSKTLSEYTFDWDFEGDGLSDKVIEGDNKITQIYEFAGVQTPKVKVTDSQGNTANFSTEVLVKEALRTSAGFDYTLEGNKVTFQNLSTAAANLTNSTLKYTWSFGDTDEESYNAQKNQIGVENPVYTYPGPGIYQVTLTVVDADQISVVTTQEVVIEDAIVGQESEDEGEVQKDPSSGSLIGKIFKVILYLILVVIALVLLIVGGLLAFLKIQNPDLVFEELVDELKIKVLSVLGVHDMIEPVSQSQPSSVSAVGGIRLDDKPIQERTVQSPQPPKKENPAPIPKEQTTGPMPDWMKNPKPAQSPMPPKEVIEGEVVEDKPLSGGKSEPLDKKDGPVPDWLKNAK